MGEASIGAKGQDQHLTRLDVLRFPLIVLIVYLHATGFTANFADGSRTLANADIVIGVQTITGSIARIAVPLFFMMSGFLFFRGAAFSEESAGVAGLVLVRVVRATFDRAIRNP